MFTFVKHSKSLLREPIQLFSIKILLRADKPESVRAASETAADSASVRAADWVLDLERDAGLAAVRAKALAQGQ